MKIFILSFLALFSFATEASICRLCKMEVTDKSVTKFEAVYKKETFQLCSLSCASRLKRKNPNFVFNVFDYISHERVSADIAFFIVKSKKLETVTEVAMSPAVIAFKDKEAANAMQKTLADGTVVHGLDAVISIYE